MTKVSGHSITLAPVQKMLWFPKRKEKKHQQHLVVTPRFPQESIDARMTIHYTCWSG